MATRTFASRLEARGPAPDQRQYREQVAIRPATGLTQRLVDRRRVEQYSGMLFADAKRKPDDVYEMTRAEHRITHLPDDELRAFVEKHIADGTVTPRSLALFLHALGRDYLSLFPSDVNVDDALWCALFKEGGEMFEAQVEAKANPTREKIANAVQQTEELVGVAQLLSAVQRAAS